MRAGNAHANRAARIGVAGFEDGKSAVQAEKEKAEAAVGSSFIQKFRIWRDERENIHELRREKVASWKAWNDKSAYKRVNLGPNPPAAAPKTRGRGNVIA